MRLTGKTAIVTGATAGIGRAIALRLADEGADVVTTDLSEQTVADTAAEVEKRGRRSLAIGVDLLDKPQVHHLFGRTVETFGKVDILVNNAGGSSHYPKPGEQQMDPASSRLPSEQVPEAYWDYIVDLNLKASFLCCQEAIPVMKRQGGGVIVNLASILGRTGKQPISGIAYSCAKGGVISLTRHLAVELAGSGIRVNAIAPGVVLTERIERVFFTQTKEFAEALVKEVPMGRFSKPSEQASVVAFLASDDASYITGAIIDVNGGWFIG